MEGSGLIKRRDFIKTTVAAAGSVAISATPFGLMAAGKQVKITILHTNDVHSRIEPFPENDSRFGGRGGFAARASLIKKIREQEEHVLLLDAGDILQGTPYFNLFGGELEFKLMSEMKYDAATIGNHDFDNGMDGLEKILPLADFPFVSSNYDFSETNLSGKIKPYHIIEKGGIRIGIYGLGVELKGLVPDTLYGKTRYHDPVANALRQEAELKKKLKCDMVVCLSHLGYRYATGKISDLTLAPKLNYTDLIIGGHTHTFMNEPHTVQNSAGNKTLIFQIGWAGVNLGRLDFIFDAQKRQKLVFAAPVKISTNSIG
jgi:5'-nucleotidase